MRTPSANYWRGSLLDYALCCFVVCVSVRCAVGCLQLAVGSFLFAVASFHFAVVFLQSAVVFLQSAVASFQLSGGKNLSADEIIESEVAFLLNAKRFLRSKVGKNLL